ncbi:MAG: recombinase RecA [Candidatus Doudnabacteria bacterium RIFCSPLOWO2_02_FULL_42_9]|uniref:Protein RecA n=1 Tax=Candidatus Doudnabacteria bacterium RIFCSPHIGHO2_01_FULL_41_86 TaxID=1817821 RepID=A0A1F5N8T0_9BACT|nr:MAG: recombinase RecA [Candidatus Doudnabacteria bacterium RIFCSPHIGHO2_01_FULL_41_86]OGE75156.1 MAG: recombinase RecA [Candidatus Doudnabacteria bacterium RIFCSPHIGHO2_01_43_10]OGE86419.1 MAG: recombinase RecA [Candidatus Doudnabacteria bacterium RIFCSPHIGHO2_12_FULL_42_22]OGE87418.1 MAG: recombinase RecA [Candidatus Doudnabacteria bacterium RIFCSPHIGHO2_02_FULL_42_25]OGE92716.1 MAG: recombinase RecA [Candidatus Doudnabacteria bacterium RIFCSPLOWO2_01_FULL_42_60]OGF01809.1 MAG: recombinase
MAKGSNKIDSSNKNLEETLTSIRDKFGEGSIMTLQKAKTMNVEVVPTGSISLDLALGAGGIPIGRVIEIFGPEASGKTTLAMHIVAEVQKKGGVAAFVDAEHALDPDRAKAVGVKIDKLLISQPDNGEQALDIVEALVRSGTVDIIVVDSVAALTPRAEIEGEMGDSHMGLHARLMSQALRKLTAIISKTNCTVIFINQIRMKIGVMFGNPETTTGGQALKFYSSVRIEIRRLAQIKQGESIVGSRVKVKIVKNKVGAPFKSTEFDIMFSEGGISHTGDLLDTGITYKVIEKTGNTYNFGDNKLGVGRENAKTFLKENPKVAQEIEKAIRRQAKDVDLALVDSNPAPVL